MSQSKSIFLSYARDDQDLAHKLIRCLEQAGYHVWFDRKGIKGGNLWMSQIVDAISTCDAFIILLSPNSIHSDNVRAELDLAKEDQKPIYPVIIQKPVTIPNRMRYQLAGWQRIELAEDFDSGLQRLIGSLWPTKIRDADPAIEDRPTDVSRSSSTIQVDLGEGVTLDLVEIPGGDFLMGSVEMDREKPPHQVTVPSFLIGQYPITQAQWKAISRLPKVDCEMDATPVFQGNKRPIEMVTWYQAVEFCDRLSRQVNQPYQLPSEAQWEYACRATTTTQYSFGDKITIDQVNCNYFVGETSDVGQYLPNPFGLYDMHGNVWEWCLDRWHENYEGAPTDGSAWIEGKSKGRILRGGSWFDIPENCRSAYRFDNSPDDHDYFIGFRVVCSVRVTP